MHLRSIAKLASLTIAAAAVSHIVSASAPAEAKEVVHATGCLNQTNYAGDYIINETGISNQSSGIGWSPRKLFCPISSNVRETLTGGIILDVHDGDNTNASTGRILANVCVQSFSGTAITCSAQTEITLNTETGFFSRTLDAEDLGVLRDTSKLYWYANLVVQLPAWNIAQSKLMGYTAL